jgi:Glycosyltransferase (GlcNAc)
MPIEQFGRYARMYTRGYDTYTPTRNYVFHDYGDQPNGHGNLEWFKNNQKQRFRTMAIDRVKLMLEIPTISEEGIGGGNNKDDERAMNTARANLGLYGLGKRRSLDDLQKFAHVNFMYAVSNAGKQAVCLHNNNNNTDYVAYNANISPFENLHDKPDDLDPQPEFPLRTMSAQVGGGSNALLLGETAALATGEVARNKSRLAMVLDLGVFGQRHVADGVDNHAGVAGIATNSMMETSEFSALPPFSVLFVLWVFGLVVWAVLYMNTPASSAAVQSTKRAVHRKILQTIKTTSHKDI